MKFQFKLVIAAAVVCFGGCDSQKSAPVVDAVAPTVTEKPAKAADNSDQYTLSVNATDLGIGAVKVPVTIKPGSEFKINKEYPWKIKVDTASDGVKVLNPEFTRDTIALKDSAATFELDCNVAAAGAHKVQATGSFSVCNDNVCKNLRDEPLTIEFVSIAK